MNITDEELDKISEVVYQNPDSECVIHSVSNPLPTNEEVIAEGDKQLIDYLTKSINAR